MKHKQLLIEALKESPNLQTEFISLSEVRHDLYLAKEDYDANMSALTEALDIEEKLDGLLAMMDSTPEHTERSVELTLTAANLALSGIAVIKKPKVGDMQAFTPSKIISNIGRDIKNALADIWATIVELIKGLIRRVKKLFSEHVSSAGRLNKQAKELAKKYKNSKLIPKKPTFPVLYNKKHLFVFNDFEAPDLVSVFNKANIKELIRYMTTDDLMLEDETITYARELVDGKSPTDAFNKYFDAVKKNFNVEKVKEPPRVIMGREVTLYLLGSPFIGSTPIAFVMVKDPRSEVPILQISGNLPLDYFQGKNVGAFNMVALSGKDISYIASELVETTDIIKKFSIDKSSYNNIHDALKKEGDRLVDQADNDNGIIGRVAARQILREIQRLTANVHGFKMDVVRKVIDASKVTLELIASAEELFEEGYEEKNTEQLLLNAPS